MSVPMAVPVNCKKNSSLNLKLLFVKMNCTDSIIKALENLELMVA